MQKITILLFAVLTSCNSVNNDAEMKIARLNKTNDSLQSIIDTLQTKYIFDEAMITSIPMLWKENKNGDIEAYIGYIATNRNEKILFSVDSLFEKCDTLKYDGGFTVKVNKEKVDRVYYKSITKPKFGKEVSVKVSDPMVNYR